MPIDEKLLPLQDTYPYYSSPKYNSCQNVFLDENKLYIYKNTRWPDDVLKNAMDKCNVPVGIYQTVCLSQDAEQMVASTLSSDDESTDFMSETNHGIHGYTHYNNNNGNRFQIELPYMKEMTKYADGNKSIIQHCKAVLNVLVKEVSIMSGALNSVSQSHIEKEQSGSIPPASSFQSCYMPFTKKRNEKRKKGIWEMDKRRKCNKH